VSVAPSTVREPPQLATEPTAIVQEPTLAAAALDPSDSAPNTARAAPRVLFAERFVAPLPGWPNNPDGIAWFQSGGYRLASRNAGSFVALAAPLPAPEGDVIISARFRKTAGPPGGGYGLVVRDQGSSTLDGQNQYGRFLVLEINDQGDIGIWQREQSRWLEVVPWTRSDAVRTGTQPNELAVKTEGPALQFIVNGSQVADLRYHGLPNDGGVGIFVGGNLNEVALEWLRIEHLER
jgi:hypothetical protein